MPHFAPPAAVKHRRESPPRTQTMLAPILQNSRQAEDVVIQPPPIRQNNNPAPVRPSRMPVFQSLAIKAYLAVSQQENFVRMAAPQPHASMPRGRMQPFVPRANIQSPPSGAYGSQFALAPGPGDSLQPIYAGVR